jgi:uncharacterized protein
VLAVGLVCFGLWSLLAAPSLKRAAEASPLGIRRSASLAVLRPIAGVSSLLGLDRFDRVADWALGRTPTPTGARALPEIPPLNVALPSPSRLGLTPGTDAGELRPSPASPSDIESNPGPVLPPPSAKHPMRVLVVGDSVATDLGYGLARVLSGKRSFSVKIDARTSTGLARDDYFDWPYQLALDIRSYRPAIVIALFGGNDMQGFFVRGKPVLYGTPEWKVQYRRRVAFVMNEVTKSHRPLVWVGMPIVSSAERSAGYRILNRIYRTEAREHDSVLYVDSWELLTDRRGRYAAYLRAPDGDLERIREADGIHLTAAGSNRLARAVFTSMRTFWAQ